MNEIRSVAVVGSGAMGAGIAQVAAVAGQQVVVFDVSTAALDRARKLIAANLKKLAEKGRLSTAEALEAEARIVFTASLDDCSSADLVIEAIAEQLDMKKKLFVELEARVAVDTILATNTSSLSVTAIAAACEAAERVVGLHFFNPPPLMALVEVIRAVQTSEEIAQTAYSLMESWGKRPVWAKDTPGFIVNRVARPFYGEALRLLDEGIADMATIDWAMTKLAGFRMGPFALMDYIGHDVNYKVTESVFASFYNDPRYKPSFTQLRLLEAGHLGRKTGRGFYDYREGAVMPAATEDERQGWSICNRILAMLINEAADACHWGVASRADIDLAVTLGLNYPKGLFAWAAEWGAANVVSQLDYLYEQYREDRYRCSPLLRHMAKEGADTVR
jgi:3-hydroxybutyryl-CoA dehydrogenase